MPDYNAWRTASRARAESAWRRINDQPTSITVRRGADTLAPQTVRVAFSTTAREDLDVRRGLNITPGVQRAIIFGVRDHPTVPDADLQRGDRFIIAHTEFEVVATMTATGELQAICEART